MPKFNKEKLNVAGNLEDRLFVVIMILLILLAISSGLFSLIFKLSIGYLILMIILVLVAIAGIAWIATMHLSEKFTEWMKSINEFLELHENSISYARSNRLDLERELEKQKEAIISCQKEIAKLKEHTNFARKENLHKVARKLL